MELSIGVTFKQNFGPYVVLDLARVGSGGRSEYWTKITVGELIMVFLIRDEV